MGEAGERKKARTQDSLKVTPRHPPRVTFVGVDTDVVDRVRALLEPAEVVSLPAGPAEALCDALLDIEPDLLFVTTDREEIFELIGELKVLPETHFIPIIAVGAEPWRLRAYAAGVNHWVSLPLPVDELGARATAAIRSAVVARAVRDSRQELRLRRDWSRFLVHDLRNLMATAVTSLAILDHRGRREPLDADHVTAVLDKARNEVLRGVRLLDDLADVDRVQKGVLRLKTAPTDLAELLRTVAVRFRDVSRDAKVALELDLCSGLIADVEASLIDRVLNNLVENALRHAPAGSAVQLRAAAAGGAALLEVTNYGPSIPRERVAELFVPFVRLENDAAPRYVGTGLGLAFCRLAVEVHGGRIGVEEPVGGGARFRVQLPVG